MIKSTITLDVQSLVDFKDAVTSSNAHVQRALRQWAARYRAFIRERFAEYSRGGGDWAPLAPSTLARRRKGRQGTNRAGGTVRMRKGGKLRDARGQFVTAVNAAILRDTGTLFAALRPTMAAPGAHERITEFGVEVGFGGAAKHPGGSATIADIASFHQFGTPRIPARPILVEPPEDVMEGMADDMDRALAKIAKDTRNA